MVFYGIGFISVCVYRYISLKQYSRAAKTIAGLLAFFSFTLGLHQRRHELLEANMILGLKTSLAFLFMIAPYVLGISSCGLLVHASNQLRKRPHSRKYRVVLMSALTMLTLLGVIFINSIWLRYEWLFYLGRAIDYIFLYLLFTFLFFIIKVFSSRVMSPNLDRTLVIILGTGLTPEGEISPMLKYRLDKAIQYQSNQVARGFTPAVLLVTGGKSHHANVSEAEVMRAYLLEKGIPDNKILVENQSINTHQNFLYSQDYLQDHEHILFVTSSFHVLRASVYASQLGIEIEGIGAKTPAYYLPYALIREYLGLFLIYRYVHLLAIAIILFTLYIYLT